MTLAPVMSRALEEAGIDGINISLDTLDPEKYAFITRVGRLAEALQGIEAALAAGFEKVKINTVLIGGFNDTEVPALAGLTLKWPVDLRFIELMPMPDSELFGPNAYIPAARVLDMLPEALPAADRDGVATLYHLPGALGNVGLISPLSAHFCGECSRLRLTADGYLKPCLHSRDELCIKGLNEAGMRDALRRAVAMKPKEHEELSFSERSQAARAMNRIGG